MVIDLLGEHRIRLVGVDRSIADRAGRVRLAHAGSLTAFVAFARPIGDAHDDNAALKTDTFEESALFSA